MSKKLIEMKWFRVVLVLVSIFGMAALASYQRRTGPTYPIDVDELVAREQVTGELLRSHGGEGGAEISLVASNAVSGEIRWRRYPTQGEWQTIEMRRDGENLVVELPHQPPAGKLEYSILLKAENQQLQLPKDEAVVIRFRADVPAGVLIPHILCMFIALAIVLRSTFGALLAEKNVGRFATWVLAFLIPGGFILGPMVQKYAFGAYWTGWPFGTDWTDNKTLAALVAWILVLVVRRWRSQLERAAVLLAAAVMMAVYLIPHSIHGSELDWSEEAAAEQTLPDPGLSEDAPDEEPSAAAAEDNS
jgi:hypothetical protein